jgi:hypothetical protein
VPGVILHDEAGVCFLDGPRRRGGDYVGKKGRSGRARLALETTFMTDAVEKVRVSRLTTPLGRFGPSEIGLVFWL